MERNNKKMISRVLRVLKKLVLLLALTACSQHTNNKIDEFYTEKGEWDSARIPFIKPYQAVLVGGDNGWSMNLKALKGGDSMVSHIENANVINGYILLHTGKTLLVGVEIKEVWWVVSPSQKIEKGFSSFWQYWTFLKTCKFEKVPHLYNMKCIASYYENHEAMNWNESKNISN